MVAYRHWEENLGNVSEVFVNKIIPSGQLPELFDKDFPGPFCLEKSFPKRLGKKTEGFRQIQ